MGKKAENNELVIPNANDTVEIKFHQSGIDTAINPFVWYFNLEYNAKFIAVRGDKIFVITEINNEILKKPITTAANGSFIRNVNAYQRMEFSQIKIQVQNANTFIQVYGDV